MSLLDLNQILNLCLRAEAALTNNPIEVSDSNLKCVIIKIIYIWKKILKFLYCHFSSSALQHYGQLPH